MFQTSTRLFEAFPQILHMYQWYTVIASGRTGKAAFQVQE